MNIESYLKMNIEKYFKIILKKKNIGELSFSIQNLLQSYNNQDAGSFEKYTRDSLVAQWLKILLLMQGTWVWVLVQENPTYHRATKSVHHNYWALVLQLLKPTHLEPVLHNKRSHCNKKAEHHNDE